MSARIAVIADTHCGSVVGLTPPGYGDERCAAATGALWNWYRQTVKQIGKVTHVFCLGDLIDGRQERDGSTGLYRVDRNEQTDMAIECLRQFAGKPKMYMVRGTPYHTGAVESFEDRIAEHFNAVIDNRLFVSIEGTVFDLRHNIGNSVLPHTRSTALMRERLLNELWSRREDGQHKADCTLRAHTHYHIYAGDTSGVAISCPCLQLAGSRFGGLKCSGIIDTGLLVIDVKGESFTWQAHLAKLPAAKAQLHRG